MMRTSFPVVFAAVALAAVGSACTKAAPAGAAPAPGASVAPARARPLSIVPRRVAWHHQTPTPREVTGELPTVVDAPEAAALNALLTTRALVGQDERELDDSTTALAYEVGLNDGALLTVLVRVDTLGAYPAVHTTPITLDVRRARRVDATALRSEGRAALVKLLDGRLREAWRTQQAALRAAPEREGSCGPAVARDFFRDEPPPLDPAVLDSVYATPRGIGFVLDLGLPHVVAACSAQVDGVVPWAEARRFVTPDGPLGGR